LVFRMAWGPSPFELDLALGGCEAFTISVMGSLLDVHDP